uniref:Uncharacterized protein n=1 Tax=Solanum lycopersicum TaxID=4081 RepID=A0A3Q7HGR5_SOLLC
MDNGCYCSGVVILRNQLKTESFMDISFSLGF